MFMLWIQMSAKWENYLCISFSSFTSFMASGSWIITTLQNTLCLSSSLDCHEQFNGGGTNKQLLLAPLEKTNANACVQMDMLHNSHLQWSCTDEDTTQMSPFNLYSEKKAFVSVSSTNNYSSQVPFALLGSFHLASIFAFLP